MTSLTTLEAAERASTNRVRRQCSARPWESGPRSPRCCQLSLQL